MKENKKLFSHAFYFEFLPKEPVIGVKVWNRELICDDGVDRPLFRIELGALFFLVSYTNVNYKDQK